MAQPPEGKKHLLPIGACVLVFLSPSSCIAVQIERFLLRAKQKAQRTPPQFAKSPMLSSLGRLQADYLIRSHQKGSRSPLSLGCAWHCHRRPPANPTPSLRPLALHILIGSLTDLVMVAVTCTATRGDTVSGAFCLHRQTQQGLHWPGLLQSFPAPWDHLRRTA